MRLDTTMRHALAALLVAAAIAGSPAAAQQPPAPRDSTHADSLLLGAGL